MKSALYFAKSGFTLIELLVVVAIITVMTGAIIPNFSKYSKNQNIKNAQEQLKSDLRNSQNKAMTQTIAPGVTANYWGIKISQTNAVTYTFFASDTDSSGDCTNPDAVTGTSGLFPGDVVVKLNSAPLCVFFSTQNGDATVVKGGSTLSCGNVTNCVIALNFLDSSTNCSGVGVNTYGLVKNIDPPISCQ